MNYYSLFFTLMFPRISDQLQIKSITSCNPGSKISVVADITTNNFIKKLNVNLTYPLGNQPIDIVIKASLDNKNFRNLASIREENSCMTLNRLIAGIWYDLQSALHIPQPGICPIQKGFYTLSNYQLDMSKLSLEDVPKALLKLILQVFGRQTNGTMVCLVITIEN